MERYPVNSRGGVTRFLVNNKENIDKLLLLYNFKEMLNVINLKCNVSISYYNALKVFNSISKIENNHNERKPDLKKELDLKQINQQPTRQEEVKEPEKTPLLDIDIYTKDKKELREFLIRVGLLSENPISKLILKYNLDYSDLEEAKMTGISSKITLNQNLTSYCMKKFGNIYK